MSMQTFVNLVPLSEPDWVPDSSFVRSLLVDFFDAARMQWLCVYSRPEYWDADVENLIPVYETEGVQILRVVDDPSLIRDEDNLDVETGIAILEATNGVCKIAEIEAGEWADAVYRELLPATRHLVEMELCPVTPLLYLGPSSIPDWYHTRTAAKTNCRIEICGYGLPKDWETYFEIVKQNKHFVALKQFVEEKSGFDWTYMMSGSW